MSKTPLILIGGGGHCKACIDVIELENKYEIHGILEAQAGFSPDVLHYPVLGDDSLIAGLVQQDFHFLITVGQIKSAAVRQKIFDQLTKLGAKMATVISPNAYVSRHARIGEGSVVMHGAIVQAGASVGKNAILNTRALVEHEVTIGDHVHISTAAVVNGSVTIGNEVFIGSLSVLRNNISIADRIVLGAGSVAVKSLTLEGTYAGNPCKLIH